jgi:hypothetical protein
MNSAIAMTEVRSALASVVKTYEPSRRIRFKSLAPFREEIRGLRSRGAAFLTIADILKTHSVKVSHETVRRFYREDIEEKPSRRKRPTNGKKRSQPSPRRQKGTKQDNEPQAKVKQERGPRIARIEDL